MDNDQYSGHDQGSTSQPNQPEYNHQSSQPSQPAPPPGQPPIQTTPQMVKKTNRKIFQITDYIFWLIEGVILIRFALKLIIADPTKGGTLPGNPFVVFIYNLTNGPVKLFQGIANDISAGANGVFEISALISMLVIWLIYLAIIRLLQISTS